MSPRVPSCCIARAMSAGTRTDFVASRIGVFRGFKIARCRDRFLSNASRSTNAHGSFSPASEVNGLRGVGEDGHGRALDVGRATYTLTGVLENAPCGDFDYACAFDVARVRARTAGTGRVIATFGALTATLDVTAKPATD